MLIPGLVSVTFRKLSTDEIVDLVGKAELVAIEWGGDVHVPHGDVAGARRVRRRTESAGLACCAYGSYYRLAEVGTGCPDFGGVLDTALALHAPLIRVWAGKIGSAEADPAYRAAVVADAGRICEQAQRAGVRIGLEYHARTLTDTNESAQQFLKEVDHPNLYLLWQPAPAMSLAERIEGLRLALPRLANVHVYHYAGGGYGPLAEIAEEWRYYFSFIRLVPEDHYCLLEFVKNDSPQAFLEDAGQLRRLLG